jgi:hypothetical protein
MPSGTMKSESINNNSNLRTKVLDATNLLKKKFHNAAAARLMPLCSLAFTCRMGAHHRARQHGKMR